MAREGQRGGLIGKALERLESATGTVVLPASRVDLLEAVYTDYGVLNRQLDDIGWSVMDYVGGSPTEMSAPGRRRVVQRARYVWANDPQAGASVELMNDFCFGRGVPRPSCKDPKVQEVVDEAWNDGDNLQVLTSAEAQLALGVDLALQSNFFVLIFDDGADGKVKLSLLRHDEVTNAVTEPDKRHRVLYYVCAAQRKMGWNYQTDTPMIGKDLAGNVVTLKPTYYEHWQNVELAEEEQGRETPFAEVKAPDNRVGQGRVYHARINRTSEQVFGVPRFQRTLRWYAAYNEFVKTRIDRAAAAAAIIMKRKIKGSPSQLARDASKLISRRSLLGSAESGVQQGPLPASIIDENDSVQHEALNLDSGSANAQQDAQMIRAPISAAERFTQAYYGDASNSNLATATSLELPILKAVESRQEVFESLFRWFIDRVIERAVDSGRISKTRTPEEMADEKAEADKDNAAQTPPDLSQPVAPDEMAAMQQSIYEAIALEEAAGHVCLEAHRVFTKRSDEVLVLVSRDPGSGQTFFRLCEAHEDQTQDEESTERDLGYEFGLPSPLRRMMGELITAISGIASTFDPNNTNTDLSRILLTVALGQGLELEDPASLVETIFPPGYQDPAVVAAQQQQQQQMAMQMAPPTPDGSAYPGGAPDGNPYSAPMNASDAGDAYSNSFLSQQSATVVWRGELSEHFDDQPEPARRQAEGRRDKVAELFGRDVVQASLEALDGEHLLSANGDHQEGT
jgi:hypothetical protein